MTDAGASVVDAIIAEATPAEREAKICVAGALNARFAVLEAELADAQQQRLVSSLGDADPRREIAEEMERLRVEMQEHEHTFTMRALPAKAWSDIRTEHGPRDGKRELFNPDTFPAALLAASCVAVDGKPTTLTAEKVSALFDVLNEGQRDTLFNAAWEANTGRVSVPFSALSSAVLQTSAQK